MNQSIQAPFCQKTSALSIYDNSEQNKRRNKELKLLQK